MSLDLVRLLLVLSAALLARAGQRALERHGRRRARRRRASGEARSKRGPLEPTAPTREAPRPSAALEQDEPRHEAASRAWRALREPRRLRRGLRLAVVLGPPRASPPDSRRL